MMYTPSRLPSITRPHGLADYTNNNELWIRQKNEHLSDLNSWTDCSAKNVTVLVFNSNSKLVFPLRITIIKVKTVSYNIFKFSLVQTTVSGEHDGKHHTYDEHWLYHQFTVLWKYSYQLILLSPYTFLSVCAILLWGGVDFSSLMNIAKNRDRARVPSLPPPPFPTTTS